jgi:hypothetical protein
MSIVLGLLDTPSYIRNIYLGYGIVNPFQYNFSKK